MNQIPQAPKPAANQKVKRYRPFSSLAKSLLVTGLFLGAIMAAAYFNGASELASTQTQEHPAIFNTSDPIQLTMVLDKDVSNAIDDMQLSPASKQALQTDLAQTAQPLAANTPSPDMAKEAAPAEKNRIRLAKITLWDIGAKDGDVIRVDSQGYSRTVILKQAPITFSIPIPADGAITITGVFDKNGTGISYGTFGWPLGTSMTTKIIQHVDQGQSLVRRVRVSE